MAKRKLASWEVSDEFWKRVEPLIPVRRRAKDQHYARKPGGGRKHGSHAMDEDGVLAPSF